MKKTALVSTLLILASPLFAADVPPAANSLSATDWAGIRAAHEDWRHRFEASADGTYSAHNPGQEWTTRFDGRGFLVEPEGKGWRWGLELRSYGVGEERVDLAAQPTVEASEAKLSYRWDDTLEEWFRNDNRGIEQGWTLTKRPAGSPTDSLRLDLAVRGGLQPEVEGEGRLVSFTETSETALTYGGLKAWDATGRDLPVRFLGGESGGIAIEVAEHDAVYPVTIDPIAMQTRLKADNADDYDALGMSAAISGNTAAVAARFEAGAANALANSGAVYVFVRNGTTWTQQAYLRAPNADAQDLFGSSVAIHGDTLAVGATGEDGSVAIKDPLNNDALSSGAVYTYKRTGSTWTFQQRIKAPNAQAFDLFGISVGLNENFLFVGASGESNSTNSIDTDDNGAMGTGAVYVFSEDSVGWNFHSYLKASTTDTADFFGESLAVSGNTLVVGATSDANKGSCAVFVYDGSAWDEEAVLTGSTTLLNDLFGTAVAVSGDTIVVGAPSEDSNVNGMVVDGNQEIGAAYVFTRSAGVWTEQAVLKASNAGVGDEFGYAVAISGDLIAVGARLEDSDGSGADNALAKDSGAVYLYRRNGTTWTQRALLKSSSVQEFGNFGRSVAMDGGMVLVGAMGEDIGAGAAYPILVSDLAPTVAIKGAKTIRVKASVKSSILRGTAADVEGDLARVEAKDTRPTGRKMFRSTTGTSSWTYRAPLKTGRNQIQVKAVDQGGNSSTISIITVIRKKS